MTNRGVRTVTKSPTLEVLESRDCPSVTYGGGPLLQAPVVHAVFYGARWLSDPQTTNVGLFLASALGDVVQSSYMDGLAQYGIGHGTPGYTVVLPQAQLNGPGWLDDSTIQNTVRSISQGSSPNELWVVFTPPGVAVSSPFGNSQRDYFGYHWYTQGSPNPRAYCVIPYPGAVEGSPYPNLGGNPFDQTALVTHEMVEACTDPTAVNGWRDTSAYYGEIADLALGSGQYFHGYRVAYYVDQNYNLVLTP